MCAIIWCFDTPKCVIFTQRWITGFCPRPVSHLDLVQTGNICYKFFFVYFCIRCGEFFSSFPGSLRRGGSIDFTSKWLNFSKRMQKHTRMTKFKTSCQTVFVRKNLFMRQQLTKIGSFYIEAGMTLDGDLRSSWKPSFKNSWQTFRKSWDYTCNVLFSLHITLRFCQRINVKATFKEYEYNLIHIR